MADEKKDPWLNYLALTTIIFAVCATLSTFKGGGYSTRSVMCQAQASDQWAFFQAKSIKGNLYEIQKDKLELELKALDPKNEVLTGEYKKSIEDCSSRIRRYEEEKKEIKQKAEDLEAARDNAKQHSTIFGQAIIFLQIAILLSSVAALLNIKRVWYVGVCCGIGGLVYFVNGFYLFFV
jgi:hypothetical protein